MENEEVFEQIIEILRELQINGESLLDIAEEIDIAHTTLYNWANGLVTSPRSDTLRKVAAHFGYEQEWTCG